MNADAQQGYNCRIVNNLQLEFVKFKSQLLIENKNNHFALVTVEVDNNELTEFIINPNSSEVVDINLPIKVPITTFGDPININSDIKFNSFMPKKTNNDQMIQVFFYRIDSPNFDVNIIKMNSTPIMLVLVLKRIDEPKFKCSPDIIDPTPNIRPRYDDIIDPTPKIRPRYENFDSWKSTSMLGLESFMGEPDLYF